MALQLGTIPIPKPIANPIPNLRGLAIAAPSYGGPQLWRAVPKQTASFLQATAGSQRTPKKKYSQLKERVKRAIDNYGREDRLTFLHAMADHAVVVLNDKNTF